MNSQFLQEIKILLVEDSDADRKILANTLRKYFKNILEANNGEEALEIYKIHKDIDLIISDITMPKMDGIEFLKRVRLNNLYLPFIFITAKLDIDTIREAINLNANYYILKPINVNELLQKIDLLCEKLFFEKRLLDKQKEIENYISAVDTVALIFKMYEDGQITYMNKAMHEISNFTIEDLKTLNFNDIIHPSIPKKLINDTWSLIKDGKLFKGDTKFISKNKEVFYLNNTVFKIKGMKKDEYITIAFLTTQENIKKRDFQRKVLLNIQETNKKEAEYKKIIEELSKKINDENNYIKTCKHQLNIEKERALNKERQLTHYELQMENTNAKYEKIITTKNEEIKTHIDTIELKKRKLNTLTSENYDLKEELKILKEKYNNLEEELNKKNKRVTDLLDIINKS
ncbi:MAG: response regulator [Halarcobacter sp.]